MHMCSSSSVPGNGWGSKYKGYVRMKNENKFTKILLNAVGIRMPKAIYSR